MSAPYSNEVKDLTIKPGCPWHDAQQSFGAPNVDWCEPTTCSIISEPANTWSNLGYLLIGLILIKKMSQKGIKAFPYAVLAMGTFSFIYHATNNYLSQFFDFVGMFLMMSFLLAFNARRILSHLQWNLFSFYWFFVALNTVIFMSFDILDWPPQPIMLINTLPIVIMDLAAGIKEGRLKEYKHLAISLSFLGVAQGFAHFRHPENMVPTRQSYPPRTCNMAHFKCYRDVFCWPPPCENE